MSAPTGTEPAQQPEGTPSDATEALATRLHAFANNREKSGLYLLIDVGMLASPLFVNAFIRDWPDQNIAEIRWQRLLGALAQLTGCGLSRGEQAACRIAASMAGYDVPLNLAEALAALDQHAREIVVDAIQSIGTGA